MQGMGFTTVRVKKASHLSLWYSEMIGRQFHKIKKIPEGWIVVDLYGHANIILKEDGEEIKN